MQFTTLAVSALSIGGALAQTGQTKVHVVRVSSSNNSLAYYPNSVTAAVGDMVQFQFAAGNHTVTQSTFDAPCQPIAMNNASVTGIYSGFVPVAQDATMTAAYSILVNSTTPLWMYCSQASHCQKGMVMVINENPAANATRTLANFKGLASNAAANLPGGAVAGGAASAQAGSSTGAADGGTTGGGASPAGGSGAIALKPAVSMGGVLAVIVALLM